VIVVDFLPGSGLEQVSHRTIEARSLQWLSCADVYGIVSLTLYVSMKLSKDRGSCRPTFVN